MNDIICIKHACHVITERTGVELSVPWCEEQFVAMVAMRLSVPCVLILLAFYKCQGQPYPFMNTSLSFEDRVKVISYYGS